MKDSLREINTIKQNTLKANSQHLRSFIDTAHEPFLLLDQDFVVVASNERFCTCFSLRKEEIEGNSFLEFINNKGETFSLLKKELSEKRRLRDFDLKLIFGKNRECDMLVNASQIELSEGENFILLAFKDISRHPDRRKTAKSFQKRFQEILSQVPAMICALKGPEHVFEFANDSYFQLVGHRDVIGKPVREAVPEVENQGFFEVLDEVYNSGKPFIGKEVPIELKVSGNERKNSFLNFLYQPTFDAESGEVEGIFVHIIDVTEHILARKKVEESENKLKNIIDTLPAIIWMADAGGDNSYLNKNWYSYTGQTEKDAKGFGWLTATHPEDTKDIEEKFRKAILKQKPFSLSYRLRDKHKNFRWVIGSGSPRVNRSGEYEGMIGTVVDVHEEKLKEQLIREKEHRMRSIVEKATVATAVYVGSEMKIELANDAMIDLWGKDRNVIGKTLQEALPELEDQPFHELLEKVYTTGKTYWGKEDRVDLVKDGKLQTGYFNFTYKALRNENGEIYGILNMATDVTEMVQSRSHLKESEAHFRQMANFMPDKVNNTDAQGNFLYFNQHWLEYTGLTGEELKKNKRLVNFLHPEEKIQVVRRWKESLRTGKDFEMELRFLNKKGKYQWHLSRAEAVYDENGEIKMWIGTNTQIQKIKEEEKRKEDFLKLVSHELKTPVTSIKGYVQLLLSMTGSKGNTAASQLAVKPSLERIDKQIDRLTRLISEMLDLSRLEESKLELQKETFSINVLIAETIQDLNYTNTQHEIKISHDYFCKVHADRDRIEQVLINFVTNAIKYSPETKDIEIKIQEAEGGCVAVSVLDQGIGIHEKYHKNIFKRFYRVDGKNQDTYGGFGIGLYLANEIIHRHNGYISMQSKKGKGSRFTFVLSVASKTE